MLRTDYCIVLHRDFQKEQHLKKEGKVCIVLGKWEVSALNILCLHIWKLYKRCNPASHCTLPERSPLTNHTCCGTRAPTQRPEKSPISSSRNHLEQKTIFFFLRDWNKLNLRLHTAVSCYSSPRELTHLVLPPLGTQRSKSFLSGSPQRNLCKK